MGGQETWRRGAQGEEWLRTFVTGAANQAERFQAEKVLRIGLDRLRCSSSVPTWSCRSAVTREECTVFPRQQRAVIALRATAGHQVLPHVRNKCTKPIAEFVQSIARPTRCASGAQSTYPSEACRDMRLSAATGRHACRADPQPQEAENRLSKVGVCCTKFTSEIKCCMNMLER